jgi:uncharacterized protein (DUF433 family)
LYQGLKVSGRASARLLATGETREQILTSYPYLEADDIDAALQYAVQLAEDETVELAG